MPPHPDSDCTVIILSTFSLSCRYFLNPLVGLFGCHHGGGMQGWIVETAEGAPSEWPPAEGVAVRFRQATTNHKWSQCTYC